MVRLVSALSLAALVTCAVAAPATVTGVQPIEVRGEGFTFEKWASDIAADPEGDHLSPEEAIQAAQESGLIKRGDLLVRDSVSCNDSGKPKASLADSVSAINNLAARGSANCHIPYASGAALSTVGLAQIYGVTVNKAGSILPCQTFAASAGRILDLCVHPGDTTVQGSNHPNSNIQIHLSRP
ncbi:hypothetical protein BJX70DRAFT_356367 [Aspergillus crustosus]